MAVAVIQPGRLIRVTPDVLDVDDVLELSAALIEEKGHVKGDSGDESRGFSIHGAVGEAAKRATGEAGKDGTRSRTLRNATALRISERNAGQSENQLNDDPATDQARAVEILLAARGEEPSVA